MYRFWVILVLLLLLSTFYGQMTSSLARQTAVGLAIGQPAPDFSLPYATKDSIARVPLRLSETIGKKNIILAFYPAAWSPGCTKEVCAMRDDFAGLESLKGAIMNPGFTTPKGMALRPG